MNAAHSWPTLLGQLIKGESLTAEAASWAMSEIMDGAATSAQIAGFGVALRMKGETPAEVDGLASAMLRLAAPLTIPGRLTDLVGTGGDRARTVNISTMGAIVAAAAGARIAKHGNRAASSACGAADVLEALGVVIDLPPAATEKLAQETGVVFLFAPLYHPALRHTAAPRRELGVPTVFNFLGPVANPARPRAQAVGVADPRMGPVLAGVLAGRGWSATGKWSRPGSTRPRSAFPAALRVTCAAAIRPATRPSRARCWQGSAARCVRRSCSTPPPRWSPTPGLRSPRGCRRHWPRATPRRRRRLTRELRRRCSIAGCGRAGGWQVRMTLGSRSRTLRRDRAASRCG